MIELGLWFFGVKVWIQDSSFQNLQHPYLPLEKVVTKNIILRIVIKNSLIVNIMLKTPVSLMVLKLEGFFKFFRSKGIDSGFRFPNWFFLNDCHIFEDFSKLYSARANSTLKMTF